MVKFWDSKQAGPEAQQEDASAVEVDHDWRTACSKDTPDATDDMARLDGFIRLMARYEAEMDLLKAQHEKRLAAVESKIRTLKWRHETWASEYTARLLEGGKGKSIKRPWGTVGFRASSARVTVEDVQAFLLQAPESMVRLKREPDMKAIQEAFKTTGEVPAGCDVQPGGDVFYVR